MGNRVLLRWVGVALLLVGVAGAADPKPLPAEQKEKLKQRDQHFAEVLKFARAGKLPEAIGELEKKLAIEREVFQEGHPEIVVSLGNLAQWNEQAEDYAKAGKAGQELLESGEVRLWNRLKY